jgi:nucleoside-diphosphate-sugar epimerase
MKLLVVGASGLIGAALCRRAEAEGWSVIRRSVRGAVPGAVDPLEADLAEAAPDVVVVCAACHSPRHGPAAWAVQVEGTVAPAVRVARAMPKNVRLAVFLGSCEEYGNTSPPFREEGPLKAFSPYGWARISAFLAVTLLAHQRGFPLTWVRPFLTFGPGQRGELLIPSLVDACVAGRSIDLTSGGQTRDFIYVEDVVSMLMTIVTSPDQATGTVLNLGSGEPRTVRDVGETIRGIVGRGQLNWGALPYRFDEAMSFYASMERWRSLFGPPPTTPFEAAIRTTVNGTPGGQST